MRVSKDKNDIAYDARERKVFLNDKEVSGEWFSADEFRRVIIMADGRTMFGNVHVERLPELKIEIDVDHITNADKVILDGLTIKEECKSLANCPTLSQSIAIREIESQFAASSPMQFPDGLIFAEKAKEQSTKPNPYAIVGRVKVKGKSKK